MILATSNSTRKELIQPGNYLARCFQMIHIGHVTDYYMGEPKRLNKVLLGWELPEELKVFKEELGEQPLAISKKYTLSLHEKANLRKDLASWRGKDFTQEEVKNFDITKLLGAACMLNIIHIQKKDNSGSYPVVAGITPVPKSLVNNVPSPINHRILWEYDKPNMEVFEKLPDWIKEEIKKSEEWARLKEPQTVNTDDGPNYDEDDQLPF